MRPTRTGVGLAHLCVPLTRTVPACCLLRMSWINKVPGLPWEGPSSCPSPCDCWTSASEMKRVWSFSKGIVKNENIHCLIKYKRKQKQLAALSCSWFLLTRSISGVLLTGVALWHRSWYWSWETRPRQCRVTPRKGGAGAPELMQRHGTWERGIRELKSSLGVFTVKYDLLIDSSSPWSRI